MDENEFTGAMNSSGAHSEAEEILGDAPSRTEQAKAAIGGVADRVADRVTEVGDQASAAVEKLAGRASGAYDRAAGGAQKVGDAIEPFVQERPYAALGIAAGVGMVLGLLLAVRGPKVVYVRPPQ
jgi:ElaB/YqjD/DUF883 family membrane-anchored ribosome-binding protein